MALGKKTRFEVFKRDNFSCGYCGRTPPAVVLEVDHILPRSKKGTDDIENLVTSCFDCNRGKTNGLLTEITPGLKYRLAEMREREEQITEYYKFLKKKDKRLRTDMNELDRHFWEMFGQPESTFKDEYLKTLKLFLAEMNKYEIMDAMDKAHARIGDDVYNTFRYFCGICWKTIKNNRAETEVVS